MSAFQISKTVLCPRTSRGVTAAGQSAINFYSNFLQFTARYRRARDAILSATNRMAPPPVLPPIFLVFAPPARHRTDRRRCDGGVDT
jgi:hypothetical protein